MEMFWNCEKFNPEIFTILQTLIEILENYYHADTFIFMKVEVYKYF